MYNRVMCKESQQIYKKSKSAPQNHCLEDLVEKPDLHKLNYWLCRFVTKMWKKDGQPYPSKTIQHILAVLQRKMLDINSDTIKFLDSSLSVFHELRRTCDNVYHDPKTQGIGATVGHMPTFSPDNSNSFSQLELWGVQLLRACSKLLFHYCKQAAML